MIIKPKLSEEDKQKIAESLDNNPLHKTERRPFNFLGLLAACVAIVLVMMFASYWVGKYYFYQ